MPGHTWSSRKKNLRPVTAWMCERAPHITIGMKICDTCRKKLSKESLDATEPVTSELDPPTPPSSQATESDPLFCHGSEAVSSLNVCLAEISETPFSKSRARSKTYCGQKVKKITEALQRTVITGAPIDDGTEMIQQLKEKFWETKRRSEQVQVPEELVGEESTAGVWCLRIFGTTVKEAGRGKRHSFSSWSITWTFTATRNSFHCF